jgi:putative (di)nucleoside polyphosphate hydrolase
MPQGRIEPAEPAREAALRLLETEAAFTSVRFLAEAPGWFTYELPSELMGIALDGRYCGQQQKWVAARFLGEAEPAATSRFRAWRWVHPREVPLLAPPLKRGLYEDVLASFAAFLAPPRPAGELAAHATTEALPWFVRPW